MSEVPDDSQPVNNPQPKRAPKKLLPPATLAAVQRAMKDMAEKPRTTETFKPAPSKVPDDSQPVNNPQPKRAPKKLLPPATLAAVQRAMKDMAGKPRTTETFKPELSEAVCEQLSKIIAERKAAGTYPL